MVLTELEPLKATSDVLPQPSPSVTCHAQGAGTEGQLSRDVTCEVSGRQTPRMMTMSLPGQGIQAGAQPLHPPNPPEPCLQPEMPFGLPAQYIY